ncbi:MAG: DUF1016 family protein [Bacilli bacterium]|nr:DUF1016 family protein [Bacilli bacterium]
MNYYNEIKEKLIKSEIYDRVKDYSKDRNKVKVYFEIGKLLSEAGKEYGKNIIKQYSEKLIVEVGKKYNERTLRRIRQFYEIFKNEKWSTTWTKLSWSHYREVISLKDINEIKYYLNECEIKSLTQRQLHDLIKNKSYNRLDNKTKNKLIKSENVEAYDLVPNPIIIKSNLLNDKINEYTLKQLILNNLDEFLIQLGTGFTYMGNEYKIKINGKYNYIDLLLFNYEYNCFVVIELKVTELKKEHIGQIQIYMNYIDENLKKSTQNKTIGIIICKQDNKYIIKYCSDDRIISRIYELV